MPARLFVALLLATMPGLAWGWGETGHRIVGELAERQLNPAARAAVAELLRDEPEPSLAGVANWADRVREREEYAHTRPWHYVNFPDLGCRYTAARDCPGGDCVIARIENFAKVLGSGAYSRQQRTEALKYLVHFVGDAHQPMHAGVGSDRGGNNLPIRYGRATWNLHSVWDALILRGAHRDWRGYAAALAARPALADDPATGSDGAPRDWALESCRAITERRLYPENGAGVIDRGYLDRHRPFAEERLRRAGDRLAGLLNQVLGQ